MGSRVRALAGVGLLAVSLTAAVLLLDMVLRAGFPRPADGARWVAYVWAVALAVALPGTAGPNLLRARPWRRFAGWWLVAVGALIPASLWWLGPAYRDWLLSILVGSVACSIPLLGAGTFLLLRPRRNRIRP
jgi:hypothetical protein